MISQLQLPVKSNFSRLEAELLLSYVMQCRREDLYTRWDHHCSIKNLKKYYCLLEQRKKGYPLAYLTNQKEFYGKKFYVAPGVFIPRGDTETIIDAVLQIHHTKLYENNQSPAQLNPASLNIIDFGCGSGCIGLTLLLLLPKARLISVDINKKALLVSRKNASQFKLLHRAHFIHKDVFHLTWQDIETVGFDRVDMIVANPPYIAFKDQQVSSEVLSFEPSNAIFSCLEGSSHLQDWLKKASEMLKPNGYYFCEIGMGQEKFLQKNLNSDLYYRRVFKDLSGKARVLCFQKVKNG